ncbi:hypothetical protein J6590_044473 [Homalodisca vitripennis]|nr:hypothetical protein J6590_044473 [Homalodisca vitripennis]
MAELHTSRKGPERVTGHYLHTRQWLMFSQMFRLVERLTCWFSVLISKPSPTKEIVSSPQQHQLMPSLQPGMLTGHGPLRKHLMRVGLSKTDECRLCGEEEEPLEPIWLNCPAISKIQKRILAEYLLSPKEIREQEPLI